MDKKITYRIIVDLIIAICILEGWWFVALPIAIVSIWKFSGFIEIIIAGIAHDSLYGLSPESGIWGYAGTITAVIIFSCLIFVKKVLRR